MYQTWVGDAQEGNTWMDVECHDQALAAQSQGESRVWDRRAVRKVGQGASPQSRSWGEAGQEHEERLGHGRITHGQRKT